MLNKITLEAINNIFSEASENLGASEKILYLDCLISHFKLKLATWENLSAFDIPITSLSHFQKFKACFENLEKAGLVIIKPTDIHFPNHWGQYIDKTELTKVEKTFLGLPIKNKEELTKELLQNDYLFELCAMRYHIKMVHYERLVNIFVLEQTAHNKNYYNFSDCFKHFTYWIKGNLQTVLTDKKTTKILGE